ncbi:MAG: glycosyltransferase family 4 protein [Chloroflexota bacterium]
MLVDAHLLGSRETGNETYITNLLAGLAGVPGVNCGAAMTPGTVLSGCSTGIDPVQLRTTGNWARLLYGLPAACRQWNAQILHVTYVAPFVLTCPTVVSVHDVSFRRFPAAFSPRDRLLFATLLPLSLRRASAVITISQHAKQEILRAYPHLQVKVYVTRLAPGDQFKPPANQASAREIRRRYGISSDYVLAVGSLQPRKNLLRLVRAFAKVHAEIRDLKLVIVGKAQWQASAVYAEVLSQGLADNVLFTGYVPDHDLVGLYGEAKAFVYPSLYEGFGLPILEAMACGTPVVVSNTSSMPEVAGDAGLFVDPFNEDEMAASISQVLCSPRLADSLVEKGLRRAKEFTWAHTAAATADVYRRLILN